MIQTALTILGTEDKPDTMLLENFEHKKLFCDSIWIPRSTAARIVREQKLLFCFFTHSFEQCHSKLELLLYKSS